MRTIARAARGAATVLLAGAFVVAANGTTAYADDNGKGNGKGKAQSAGANGDCGQYCSTRDGSPSRNGNGGGEATGRPCAGCVGNADDKNPPGQYPDGSDSNNGYECDGNSGIARTNPAHTGCTTPAPAVEEPVAGPVTAPVQAPGTTDPAAGQAEAPLVAGVKVVAAPAVGAVGAKAPAEPQDASGIAPGVLGTRFAKPASGPGVAGGEGSLPFTGGTTVELLLAAVALLSTGVLVTRAGSARA